MLHVTPQYGDAAGFKRVKFAAILSSEDNFCETWQGERVHCSAASEKYPLIFQH